MLDCEENIRAMIRYHPCASPITARNPCDVAPARPSCPDHRQGTTLAFVPCQLSPKYSVPCQKIVPCVDAFLGPTHECTRTCGTRRSSLQHLLRRPVRSVVGTGQTGFAGVNRRRNNEHSSVKDPVGTSASRVTLGSAGHLERPQST